MGRRRNRTPGETGAAPGKHGDDAPSQGKCGGGVPGRAFPSPHFPCVGARQAQRAWRPRRPPSGPPCRPQGGFRALRVLYSLCAAGGLLSIAFFPSARVPGRWRRGRQARGTRGRPPGRNRRNHFGSTGSICGAFFSRRKALYSPISPVSQSKTPSAYQLFPL